MLHNCTKSHKIVFHPDLNFGFVEVDSSGGRKTEVDDDAAELVVAFVLGQNGRELARDVGQGEDGAHEGEHCARQERRLVRLESWSSGYGRILMIKRSWVWIPAPDTRWSFLHWFFVVKIVLFAWKTQKYTKRGHGWSIFIKEWQLIVDLTKKF